MAIELGRFGSVFKYRDGYFVYLAMTAEGDRLFAAKILNAEDTSSLRGMSAKYEKRPNHSMSGSLALCFVVLTTDDFNGQAAAFLGTGDNVDLNGNIDFIGKSLNEDDAKELQQTILKENAIPSLLAKLVKEMFGDNSA
jgi:hypothetical protein